MQKINAHIVIDQTETIEPKASCFLSDTINQTNYRTNLDQLTTLLTLQDLLNSEDTESNRLLINKLQYKTRIKLRSTVERLKDAIFDVFYYINADGGDQNLSDSLESINQRILKTNGQCVSFISQKACGSGGIAFFTSSNQHRYHSYDVTAGISLNLLEAYFYENQTELESDFTLFNQMQNIVTRKIGKLENIVVSACSPLMQIPAERFIKSQLNSEQNTRQQIIMNHNQLSEFEISHLNPNHFENLSKHIDNDNLELTLSIQKVYDFLEANSITYH